MALRVLAQPGLLGRRDSHAGARHWRQRVDLQRARCRAVASARVSPARSSRPGPRDTPRDGSPNSTSGGAFLDWRRHNTRFTALALLNRVTRNLRTPGEPERLRGLEASHELLEVLGVTPRLGRGFLPQDDLPGGTNNVVLITEELWRSRFGADPGLVESRDRARRGATYGDRDSAAGRLVVRRGLVLHSRRAVARHPASGTVAALGGCFRATRAGRDRGRRRPRVEDDKRPAQR